MPYEIQPRDGKFCVVAEDGETVHCHESEEMAKRQLAALYANEPEARKKSLDDALLITFGGAVKAMGAGKIGGYLVRFTGPDQTDIDGEFFTKDTDFDRDLPTSLSVYYHHGFDPTLGRRKLGRAEVKADDVGLWLEAQLKMRDRYEQAIYAMVEAGKLDWSSGAVTHLVEKEPAGKAVRLSRWPLGEASLTYRPAMPFNTAVALKSVHAPLFEDLAAEVKAGLPPGCTCGQKSGALLLDGETLVDRTERVCVALKAVSGEYGRLAEYAVKEGRALSHARRGRIQSIRESLSALLAGLDELLSETEPKPKEEEQLTQAMQEERQATDRLRTDFLRQQSRREPLGVGP